MNSVRYHQLEESYLEHGGEHLKLFKRLANSLSDIPFTSCCVDIKTYEHDAVFSLNISDYGEIVVIAPKNQWPEKGEFPWSFYISEDCVCQGVLPVLTLVEKCRSAISGIVTLLKSTCVFSNVLKGRSLYTC